MHTYLHCKISKQHINSGKDTDDNIRKVTQLHWGFNSFCNTNLLVSISPHLLHLIPLHFPEYPLAAIGDKQQNTFSQTLPSIHCISFLYLSFIFGLQQADTWLRVILTWSNTLETVQQHVGTYEEGGSLGDTNFVKDSAHCYYIAQSRICIPQWKQWNLEIFAND